MFQSNIRAEARTIAKTGMKLFLMLAATAACAVLLGGRLGVMVEKLAECPPEVVALLGIYDINEKHISLMVFYMVVILLNIVAVSKAAGAAVEVIKEDEENGSIRFFVNQTYNVDQVWIGKTVIAMFSAVAQWLVYIASMLLMVWLICYRCGSNFGLELGNVVTIGIRGIVFVVLAVGICLLYSLTEEPGMTYEYFCSSVFYGMLLSVNKVKEPQIARSSVIADTMKSIVWAMLHYGMKVFGIKGEFVWRKCMQAMRQYENTKNQRRTTFAADASKWIVYDEEIRDVEELAFEDIVVAVPKGYDAILKRNYGDYMEMPPEDQRVNHMPVKIRFLDEKDIVFSEES